jgi:putative ABC transport system permease protein
MLIDFLTDVRYSLRALIRTPVFAITAVAALTLGIGANIAIFSVVNTVLLHRLPYPHADRIVMFVTQTPAGAFGGASPTKLHQWKQQGGVFEDVSAYRFRFGAVAEAAKNEQVRIGEVSHDFFHLFGASFQDGRTFIADEHRPGGNRVAILSAGFARRYFGSSSALNRTFSIDREPYLVVGVLDPAFDGETLAGPAIGNPDIWLPLETDPSSTDQTNTLVAVARLASGATLQSGQSQLHAVTQRFREAYPGIIGPKDVFSVQTLHETMVQDVRLSLLVLQGAVGFVLLIACANVASLLLVRSTARAREIAVKAALGAGRGRIVRQLVTESLVLSVMGGVLGLSVGILGIQVLLTIYPDNLAWVGEIGLRSIDGTVLGFTVLVTLLTTTLAGLFPTFHAAGLDLNRVLKAGATWSAGGGGSQGRTRSLLIAAEIALAVVLLVGAALLGRTFLALRAVDPGFDATGVLTLRMSLDDRRVLRTAALEQLIETGQQRLRTVPGVVASGTSCCMPLENDMRLRMIVVGRPLAGAYHAMSSWRSVSTGYFEALKIPVLQGRQFTDQDRLGAPGVVIVNQTMSRQLWPAGDPLSDSIQIGKGLGPNFAGEPTRRIIGIVGDVRDAALDADPRPTLYVPIAQLPDSVMKQTMGMLPLTWIVRTSAPTQAVSRTIEAELHGLGSSPIPESRRLSDVVREATADRNFSLLIITVLASAALLLAVIGLNGLMSYAVQLRTKEIGVRLALGADAAQVRNMIVSQGMRLVLASIAAGTICALLLTRFIATFLFGVSQYDPAVFGGVPAVVALTSLIAVWLPASTIANLDVLRALRAE